MNGIAERLASQAAVPESLRVLEGESWKEYRDRYHSQAAGDGRRRPDGKCHCPHAYSLCAASMYWRYAYRELQVHGGWGWPTEWHTSQAGDHRIALYPAAATDADNGYGVGWAVETRTANTNQRCDREAFPNEELARDYANRVWRTH